MTQWQKKTANTTISLLAPEWYLGMKAQGANKKTLSEAVRQFCLKHMPPQEVDDALVDLMIASYES